MIIWEGKTGNTFRAPVHRIGLFKQSFTSYASRNSTILDEAEEGNCFLPEDE